MSHKMTPVRFFSTATFGAFAGWGVGKLYPHINPNFHMDPRAVAIAALVGAALYAAGHNAQIKNFYHGKPVAANEKLKHDIAHCGLTALATAVAYAILRYSKYNSTIGQTLTGVFIGFGAKLVVDYFWPASKSAYRRL